MFITYNSLAHQVLSNSVAEALAFDGKPDTRETQRFVSMFNRFFDMMNVRSLKEATLKRQTDKAPYRYLDDKRIQVTTNSSNACSILIDNFANTIIIYITIQ